MNTRNLCLLLLASTCLVGLASADDDYYRRCVSGRKSMTIEGDDEEFGCKGFDNKVDWTWTLVDDDARTVTAEPWDLGDDELYVTLAPGMKQEKFTRKSSDSKTWNIVPKAPAKFRFVSDGSVTGSGFKLTLSEGPDVEELQNGVAKVITKEQSGGFVFAFFEGLRYGKKLTLSLEVAQFAGLKSPGLFVSRNAFPELSDYDAKADSTVVSNSDPSHLCPGGGKPCGRSCIDPSKTCHQTTTIYGATIEVDNPKDGSWMTGIFMYGQLSTMAVTATWTFELPTLKNQVTVEDKVTGSAEKCYMIDLSGTSTTSLTFMMSRVEPGGYPRAYIRHAMVPGHKDDDYDVKLDTAESSFAQHVWTNPVKRDGHYGGLYVFCMRSDGNANYLIQASWS